MPFVPAKCTRCGASLEVDPARDAALCQHCGTPFIVEKAIQHYNTTIHAQNVIIQAPNRDFEIRAGVLVKYHGAAVDVVVPEGVVEIGEGAFKGFTNLRSVKLPSGVRGIGADAFRDCASLRSINLPEGLKEIGGYAFSNCKSLESVDLPESLCIIEWYAFSNCEKLKSVVLPAKISRFYSPDIVVPNEYEVNELTEGCICRRVFEGCTGMAFYVYSPGLVRSTRGTSTSPFPPQAQYEPHPSVENLKIQQWRWIAQGNCKYCGGPLKCKWIKWKCKSCGRLFENYNETMKL